MDGVIPLAIVLRGVAKSTVKTVSGISCGPPPGDHARILCKAAFGEEVGLTDQHGSKANSQSDTSVLQATIYRQLSQNLRSCLILHRALPNVLLADHSRPYRLHKSLYYRA